MKQIFTLVLIAFVFLSSTCKKELQLPDPELKKIFGKWEWVESSGGFAGKTITPVSEAYTARIEFRSDGKYEKYKSGTLIEQKRFSFSQETSIHNRKPVWAVSFDESSLKMSVAFSGQDTLLLNEQLYDGYGHVYARIK